MGSQYNKEDYYRYLESITWKLKRLEVLKRDRFRCRDCGRCNCSLQVHHLTYANLYDEPLEDLITLCDDCHKKRHGIEEKPLPTDAEILKLANEVLAPRRKPPPEEPQSTVVVKIIKLDPQPLDPETERIWQELCRTLI